MHAVLNQNQVEMMKITLTLTLDIDPRITLPQLRAHVKDAVQFWGRQLHPMDPLFSGIKVKKIETEEKHRTRINKEIQRDLMDSITFQK